MQASFHFSNPNPDIHKPTIKNVHKIYLIFFPDRKNYF